MQCWAWPSGPLFVRAGGWDIVISQFVNLYFAGCVETGDIASVGTLIQGPVRPGLRGGGQDTDSQCL